jgi:TolB-like protein/Tfp pilus assembly protein PilF
VNRLTRFAKELHRRKVTRAVVAYAAAAFVVLQVVSAVFPTLPLPEWSDTLVTVLLALGFPVTVALAWALELTPHGLREEMSADEAAALAATKELRTDSIAVMPFDNLSADPENEYFSDGVTEDIIASIARIRGIRVLSRASVLRYKGQRRPLDEIARELGVATIVTGSVRRSDGRLRIVVQVLDARDDRHLWSETYDRGLGDVFQVQSEVAVHVAEAVRRELTVSEQRGIATRGTSDPEAYDLYLRARFLWNQRDVSAVAESVDFFRRAAERDPSFALAHAGLADAYVILGIYGVRAPAEVYPAARHAAHAALAIDPGQGEAAAALACVAAVYEWEWRAAEEQFRQAIDLSPSYATAHQWYGMNVLLPQARFTEALAALDRALELDRMSPAIATGRGIVYLYARDYARARQQFEIVAKEHPNFGLVHHFIGLCHGAEGHLGEAITSAADAVRLYRGSSETLAAQGRALARSGRSAEADAVLAELRRRAAGEYASPVFLAQVLIGQGRTEEALDELERAIEIRASDLIWLAVSPTYETLAGSGRFQEILARVGLPRR